VSTNGTKVVVFSAKGRKEINTPAHTASDNIPTLKWSERSGSLEATGNTSKWAASAEPKPMEQYDDYPNGWGWYRTTIHRDAPENATVKFNGAGDVLRFYLNGQRVSGDKSGATLSLQAGDNELAVLCWTEGRPKMYNFVGATHLMAAKGIWGPVTLTIGSGETAEHVSQVNWRFHPGLSTLQETPLIATVKNWTGFLKGKGLGDWTTPLDQSTAPNTPLFFRSDFTFKADPMLHQPLALRTDGLKSGSVWINGHNLGPYKNTRGQATEMYVPECWLSNGVNTILVFDAEGAAPSKTSLQPMETLVKMQLPK
jgi:hypothetical protein